MTINEKYDARVQKANSLVCVGLDSDASRIPKRFAGEKFFQLAFNKEIIEATKKYVSSYKMNMAFYEAQGDKGIRELKMTLDYLRKTAPDIVTICDAKRGDIASTNEAYAKAIFDWLGFDAVTLNPYCGKEALLPFLERKDKGSIILCRTSNPGTRDFQDMLVGSEPLWQVVAKKVYKEWNENANCFLVAGATCPKELAIIRRIAPDMTLLVPGIGTQGGDIKETLGAGLDMRGKGLMIHSARSIIFSENPKEAARSLRDAINAGRKRQQKTLH